MSSRSDVMLFARSRRALITFGLSGALVSGCGTEPAKPVVTSIEVTPATPQLEVGSTVTLAAVVYDQDANVLTGHVIAWSSADPAIAGVSATGIVSALQPGTTTIRATADGKSGSATVVVVPIPVASVHVIEVPGRVFVGETVTLRAAMADRNGYPLTNRPITWSSDAPEIATIDGNGVLRAISPGSVSVTAMSEGIKGSAVIPILPLGSVDPTITSVAPAILQPGQPVTLTGIGFDVEAARNIVTVGGARARVISASATQLGIVVPCVQGGTVDIRVTTNGRVGQASSHLLQVPQRALTPGQSLVISDNQQAICNELVSTGNARYVLAVYSASTSSNSLSDFELHGNVSPTGAALKIVPLTRPLSVNGDEATSKLERNHAEFLERDRQQFVDLQARARRRPSQRSLRIPTPLPSAGDMRTIYFAFSGGCNDSTRQIRGKAIYVGSRSVIWEDSANTLQSADDPALEGYYRRVGQIFDQDQYESIKASFGDPLRRDDETDGDGRVHMVFTQRLNGSGAAAYVISCDQFDRTLAPGSNFGQFFYGMVPTTAGSNLNSTSFPDGWFYFMARTVVHEVKHIASHSARVANGAQSLESTWLEEGTARHAEELWVRERLHRVSWKGNSGFGSSASNGIFCDFHPENQQCNAADPLRRPGYGMRRQFNELREKLVQPWNWSVYGDGPGQNGSVFYQTAWSLVRYAIDRYGSSEAAFLTALTNARNFGVNNLAAVTGVPMERLIGEWSLALYLDDHPSMPATNLDIQIPTWNLRSIYGGLNTDPIWSTRWNAPYPIQPTPLPFGTFSTMQLGVRGGAAAYFEITGTQTTTQLLGLRDLSGSSVSPNIRIAIARLQ